MYMGPNSIWVSEEGECFVTQTMQILVSDAVSTALPAPAI